MAGRRTIRNLSPIIGRTIELMKPLNCVCLRSSSRPVPSMDYHGKLRPRYYNAAMGLKNRPLGRRLPDYGSKGHFMTDLKIVERKMKVSYKPTADNKPIASMDQFACLAGKQKQRR